MLLAGISRNLTCNIVILIYILCTGLSRWSYTIEVGFSVLLVCGGRLEPSDTRGEPPVKFTASLRVLFPSFNTLVPSKQRAHPLLGKISVCSRKAQGCCGPAGWLCWMAGTQPGRQMDILSITPQLLMAMLMQQRMRPGIRLPPAAILLSSRCITHSGVGLLNHPIIYWGT
jgi:hypothetical protein